MTDYDARFWPRFCAEPDEDMPRLALADWLEEEGQTERAAFIRRADRPGPHAALGTLRGPLPMAETRLGERSALPRHTTTGRWPRCRVARERLRARPRLAAQRPLAAGLGEDRASHARPAHRSRRTPSVECRTLDDWRASQVPPGSTTAQGSLRRQPDRTASRLRDTPAALGITDIYLARAAAPAMPFVVEDLLARRSVKSFADCTFTWATKCSMT